jgi:hypothetical protein
MQVSSMKLRLWVRILQHAGTWNPEGIAPQLSHSF